MKQKFRLNIAYTAVLMLLVLTGCSLSNPEYSKSPRPEKETFQIDSLDQATAIVSDYFDGSHSCQALDYAVNDSGKGFLNYAIIFDDPEHFEQANLLVNTTNGNTRIRFGDDEQAFKYFPEDGMHVQNSDEIVFSCYEFYEGEMWDFKLTCVKISNIDTHFKSEAGPRK